MQNRNQELYFSLLEKEVNSLLESFQKVFSKYDTELIRSLIEGSEFGVALETLCGAVLENKYPLNDYQKGQIKILAEVMKIDDRFWHHLV